MIRRRQHCLWYMTSRMPEEGREAPTAADLEDDYAWDGERDLPEWQDGADDNGISPTGNEPP